MFNNQVIAGSSGQGGGFYDFPIEQSLRFEDGDSAYLSRTPASAGNRKTWTWSGWVKKSFSSTTDTVLFSANNGGNQWFLIGFSGGNTGIDVDWYNGSTRLARKFSNADFRDVSAWYNVVVAVDTTDGTAEDRIKVYINGVRVTSWSTNTNPSQNSDTYINSTNLHTVGKNASTSQSNYFDGYLADVNFIDGQALDATSFGETKSGIWIPKDTADLTFGTNGFRLQFGDTTEANGFNTVTYTGNQTNGHAISGVGFSSAPDFVWIKERSSTSSHLLVDSVRGADKGLASNATTADENLTAGEFASFDSDGFTVDNNNRSNQSGQTYVAWAWDAGSGSAASNTDGDITSTVKVNTDYGFSIASFTGASTQGATFGHALGVAPDVVIAKARTAAQSWWVYHSSLGYTKNTLLNSTNASATDNNTWLADPTSSLVTIGDNFTSSNNYIAYCFAEKTGYSKISTYTGTGAAGNSITTGFKPAFLLIKETGNANSWELFDNTRNTSSPFDKRLFPNDSAAEATTTSLSYSDTGFETLNGNTGINRSGGTYIYMAFADTRDAAFWKDTSGEGNDWQPNNLVFSDVVPDSSSNNFAVWSPLAANSSAQFREGNLEAAAADNRSVKASFNMPSGKWYWENRMDGGQPFVGICPDTMSDSVTPNSSGTDTVQYYFDGRVFINVVSQGNIGSYTTGDIIGITFDASIHQVTFYKNNTQVGQYTAPDTDKIYVPFLSAGSANAFVQGNFGQDSTFAGNTTAGGNADENGYGDFKYAPPSGFLSLCSANLPSGAIDTLADETPEDYFNTILYTGDASTPRSITSVGFQPDWLWIKERSSTSSHVLMDAVRGASKFLVSDSTQAEATATSIHQSFDADGFTIGNSGAVNESGQTYVAWNWKANGAGVSNTDGSITSTVSVSQTGDGTKWFSVVGFTTQAGGYTVGHGLGQKPSLVITKNRDTAGGAWYTFTDIIDGSVDYLALNQTSAKLNDPFGLANPTSSVFSLDDDYIFGSGDCIAYCFANAEGLCKVGKYGPGTGNSEGPFVYTGFRPAFILAKRYDGVVSWSIWDNERDGINPTEKYLLPNLSNAESSASSTGVDFLSNGFKLRGGSAIGNLSGGNYIYLAIASQPFKYSNAR